MAAAQLGVRSKATTAQLRRQISSCNRTCFLDPQKHVQVNEIVKLDRIDKIFFGVPLASCHICVAEYCRNKPLTSFLVVYHRRMFPSNLLLLQSLKIIFFRSFFDFFEVFCHTTSSDETIPSQSVGQKVQGAQAGTDRHRPAFNQSCAPAVPDVNASQFVNPFVKTKGR